MTTPSLQREYDRLYRNFSGVTYEPATIRRPVVEPWKIASVIVGAFFALAYGIPAFFWIVVMLGRWL